MRGWTSFRTRRRDDFIYTAAQTTRVSVASRVRSGAERADGTDKTCDDGGREGGNVGQFVSHFISGLGHPSADSPPLPLWTTSVNEDFISILGGVY